MKFELSTIENDLEFNKKLKPIKQQEWKDLYFHSFKNFVLFITGVSSASIFLFLNKVSFQQQIDFVTQSNFNCSLMFLFGIYCFFLIINFLLFGCQLRWVYLLFLLCLLIMKEIHFFLIVLFRLFMWFNNFFNTTYFI